jgi:antirestriction protein ArdC
LLLSGFGDPRWLTFKQARKLGLHVRKGERSTKIVRMVELERKAADAQKDGEVVGEENGKFLVMRFYDVFNGSQIEGMPPLPERAHTVQPVDSAEAIIEGMKRTGLSVRYGFPGASYSMSDDLIRMPDKANFHSTEDFYLSVLHEIVHSTGSHKRLQRLFGRFGSPEYAKEELRAELAAVWICSEIGLIDGRGHGQAQQHLENSAAYIASWLELLRRDKNEIFRAAADAQRACDYIREHTIEAKPKLVQGPDFEVPQPIAAKRRGLQM